MTWTQEKFETAPITGLRGLFGDVPEGFSYAANDEPLKFCLISIVAICVFWGIAFTVGIPILVKESFCDNVALYGYIVASYGVGSVLGNVLCANLHVRSSWLNVFGGDAICGLGFVLIAFGNSVLMAVVGSMLAAIGAAAADLLLLNLLMKEVPSRLLGKVLSLRMMTLSGGHSLGLIIAAPFFKFACAQMVIGWCGLLMALIAGFGAIRFAKYKKSES